MAGARFAVFAAAVVLAVVFVAVVFRAAAFFGAAFFGVLFFGAGCFATASPAGVVLFSAAVFFATMAATPSHM
ncbi:hypothetical protein [Streptomyces sp. N2A]|uniref:hypothetical protein n=1 Tax=Streptomyces sp. N2A TaxID=3073936 RepID=UPI0037DA0888